MRSSKNKAGQPSGTPRASSSSHAAPPPPPPPVPPRPTPQKQPKGAFGTRTQRHGYVPESPGDEPSVNGDNYFTTRTHTNLFNETSSATRARRRAPPDVNHGSPPLDARQSTPYQTQGGEKFDPWNGASNVSRSRSTREQNRRPYNDNEEEAAAYANARQRSASVPDESENVPQAGRAGKEGFDANDRQKAGSTTATGDYGPQNGFKNGGAANGRDSPKVYAKQSRFSKSSPPKVPRPEVPRNVRQATSPVGDEDFYSRKTMNLPPELQELLDQEYAKAQSSSEDKPPPRGRRNAFEENLHQLILALSTSKYGMSGQSATGPQTQMHGANRTSKNSFSPQLDGDSHRFSRNSTDNINTRFVAEEDATNWQFNAGSPVDETGQPAKPRSKSGSRVGRASPFNPPASQTPFASPKNRANGASGGANGSFNPEEWTEKIGPQIFEAPAAQKSAMPTSRSIRNPSKKTKPVRMTAGTAGMVESDESSSGQDDNPKGQSAPGGGLGGIDGAASPNAMDVDPPSAATPAENSVRNIPVTPSRPEWRAGDVGLGINNGKPGATGQQAMFTPPAGGSEDTEEFRANFADFRNVEPFTERATGLESFGDLKTSLPFPSSASAPVRKPVPKTQQIALPEPPKAPQMPPTLAFPSLKPSAMAWKKYMDEWTTYVQEFALYNARFIDHFHARKIQVHEKLSSSAWLESRDQAGLREYMTWFREDAEVRAKWSEACNAHELNVRNYICHREKMMS